MSDQLQRILEGDVELLENVSDAAEVPDSPREELKRQKKEFVSRVYQRSEMERIARAEKKSFLLFYRMVAVISCLLLIGVLLFTVANIPRYGEENPRTLEVVRRYVEQGLQETGALNIVSGMILDYRAFDTLGESHVLFTAFLCVMTLLLLDKKTIRGGALDDYHRVRQDTYFDLSGDAVIRLVGTVLVPSILLFGVYVILNGQNGPGGGFSGGAIMGAGFILFATAFGFERADRVLSRKVLSRIVFCSLAFYSFAKGYVFFTGANGLENHIPRGKPGAILSGGLILPLDIAVGIVVACTMYGFYSLFKRGNIGGDRTSSDK